MPTRKRIVYNDFSGGEYGDLGGYKAKEELPGSWTGKNMRLLQDGSLCPRPGVLKLTIANQPSGVCHGLVNLPVPSNELQVVIGTAVYNLGTFSAASMDFSGAALTGALSGAPTFELVFTWIDPHEYYISSPDENVYKCDIVADTAAQVTSWEGGYAAAWWRDRLYVGGKPNDQPGQYRVFYSEEASDTYNANNYFDVTYWWPVHHLLSFHDKLLISQEGHVEGWWHLLNDPETGSLKQLGFEGTSPKQRTVVHDPNNNQVISFGRNRLYTMDGTTIERFTHLGNPTYDEYPQGDISTEDEHVVFVDTQNKGITRSWGAWAYTDFTQLTDDGEDSFSGQITQQGATRFVVVDDHATAPSFYVYDPGHPAPGKTTGGMNRPGDNSATPLDAWFHMPEEWSEPGHEYRVKQVIVDFTKYNWDAGAGSNQMHLYVGLLSRQGVPAFPSETDGVLKAHGVTRTAPYKWTEATSAAATYTSDGSSNGTRDRMTFDIAGGGESAGFVIGIEDIIGVKIHSITVDVDEYEETPAYAAE